MTNEEIMAKAKRDYPVGTTYYIAHMNDEIATVSNTDTFEMLDDNSIQESHGNEDKNGHYYTECILHDGKWATIISSPKPKELDYQIY